MTFNFRPLAVALFVLATAAMTFGAALAQPFSAEQRTEVEKIIREYLLRNPQLLQEVIAELDKIREAAEADKNREAVKQHASLIFNSPRQVTIGNPKGDVTLVEFFDYNCGFCRRALADKIELMKLDPNLRVVLKELPVLGEGSLQAAQIAVAVRMQTNAQISGQKYFEFHQKMFASRGPIDGKRALAVAREIGLDTGRIEKDLKTNEIQLTIEESSKLAELLGINGTPTYVVGNEVVVGAVGVPKLRMAINLARCGKTTC